jgi:hypothetical protein
MSDKREHEAVDPRLHAYLDGELSPSDAAAFEGDLRPGSTSRNRLKTLRNIEAWFQATRPRAPSSLGGAVERALAPKGSFTTPTTAPPTSSRLTPRAWWNRRTAAPRARWALVGAAAAVLIIYLYIPPARDLVRPGPDAPLPDRAESQAVEIPAGPATVETTQPIGQNTVRYTFRIEAGEAREVCLAGDFNRWRVCEAPLERVGEDVWSVSLDLPPGRYEYMFVVDGKWMTDPHAANHVDDGFGNRNALLII